MSKSQMCDDPFIPFFYISPVSRLSWIKHGPRPGYGASVHPAAQENLETACWLRRLGYNILRDLGKHEFSSFIQCVKRPFWVRNSITRAKELRKNSFLQDKSSHLVISLQAGCYFLDSPIYTSISLAYVNNSSSVDVSKAVATETSWGQDSSIVWYK